MTLGHGEGLISRYGPKTTKPGMESLHGECGCRLVKLLQSPFVCLALILQLVRLWLSSLFINVRRAIIRGSLDCLLGFL